METTGTEDEYRPLPSGTASVEASVECEEGTVEILNVTDFGEEALICKANNGSRPALVASGLWL